MKKQVLIAGIVLTSLFTPLEAKAVSLSGLYVFGDSLSDAGNTFKETLNPLSGNGFPPPPYAGRFSNGPVWVEYLGQELGLTPTLFSDVSTGASFKDGINFAVGGATTGTDNTLALTASLVSLVPQLANLPSLQQQIATFSDLIPAGGAADPNALYIVWAGANDYLPNSGTFTPAQTPVQPLANLTNAVASLDRLGAKNIMVVNLPSLGQTPLLLGLDQSFPGASQALNTLVGFHNQGLEGLKQQVSPDVNLIDLDVNTLFNQITGDPVKFGFTNLTESCLNLTTFVSCSNPDKYLFWDQFHPTTVAHEKIAELALSALEDQSPSSVPEPTSTLGLLAFGVWGVRKVWQQHGVKG
jgi:phospholipase/lecithinase/hemolysin